MSKISTRKIEHLNICLDQPVRFKKKRTGFEHYDFLHCALPELNFNQIDTSILFLGKRLTFPFMISAMTGGHGQTEKFNRDIAILAGECGVAMGVGSQRQFFEDSSAVRSYAIVRKENPKGIIIGNIGGAQVATMPDLSSVRSLVDMIEADAMAIHLNPLQEILQPEGDNNFCGVLQGIEELCRLLPVPVIIKEVGCGISPDVARRLCDAGVEWIDVAGAGGTSWAGIEMARREDGLHDDLFWDWGIPTAVSIELLQSIKGLKLIASGGIDNGITLAKSIALGANIAAAALPVLLKLSQHGIDETISWLRKWQLDFKRVLFLTGCEDPIQLRHKSVLYSDRKEEC
ncbi:type 2 isopentenyl-diphosphate Delta-isomerase [bacterium]|nr:type 2 isopentenyl-diphosphate Delta-isomerase [bacterium]